MNYLFDQTNNTCYFKGVYTLLKLFPLLQADALLEYHRNIGADGHKSQTADLYHTEYDKLSKRRPVLVCVSDDQPGDAGRRSRCKEGIKHIPMTRLVRKGKRQEKCSCQNDHCKAKCDQSCGGLSGFRLLVADFICHDILSFTFIFYILYCWSVFSTSSTTNQCQLYHVCRIKQ